VNIQELGIKRSPLQAALLHPLNLAMLGITVFAGLAAAWWLAPAGIVLWIVMITTVATDPSIRFMLAMENRSPVAKRFQGPFKQIQRVEAAYYNTLNNASRATWRRFQGIMEKVHSITNQSHALCLRLSAMENHRMVTYANRDLKAELRMLDVQIEAAESDILKQEYQEQHKDLSDRVQSLESLESILDRMETLLRRSSTELETSLTLVIRLQTLDPRRTVEELPGVLASLTELETEINTFDQELQLSLI